MFGCMARYISTYSFPFHFAGQVMNDNCVRIGRRENTEAGQRALLIRAKANSLANLGKYTGDAAGTGVASKSLHVAGYTY
jgi:hypothetical protein